MPYATSRHAQRCDAAHAASLRSTRGAICLPSLRSFRPRRSRRRSTCAARRACGAAGAGLAAHRGGEEAWTKAKQQKARARNQREDTKNARRGEGAPRPSICPARYRSRQPVLCNQRPAAAPGAAAVRDERFQGCSAMALKRPAAAAGAAAGRDEGWY